MFRNFEPKIDESKVVLDHINIVTPPPGPNAKKVKEAIDKYSTQFCGTYPLVMTPSGLGKGAYVVDIDGNTFLDWNSMIATVPLGYNHPAMIEVAMKYSKRAPLKIAGDDFYTLERIRLQEKLAEITPKQITRSFLVNSGAEAVENAIKIAYWYTKRPLGVSVEGAFHGRTLGALSFTNSNIQHKENFPTLPAKRIPFVPEGEDPEPAIEKVYRLLYQDAAPSDVAFFIFEPIQGEGGYRIPNREYIRALRDITRDKGIMLIADEVQAGMGRSGKFWAHEYFDIEVDLMTSGKALQVGAAMGTDENFPLQPKDACRVSSTWGGGDIFAMAIGLAVIEAIEKENLIENARKQGEYMLHELKKLAQDFPQYIKNPRGRGLFVGIDITDKKAFDPEAKKLRNKIVDLAYENGLLVLGAGWSSIRFAPPLIVGKKEIDEGMGVLRKILESLK